MTSRSTLAQSHASFIAALSAMHPTSGTGGNGPRDQVQDLESLGRYIGEFNAALEAHLQNVENDAWDLGARGAEGSSGYAVDNIDDIRIAAERAAQDMRDEGI